MRETDRSSEKENGKGWLQDQTISSQISHMGLCQHTYWKSNIWFTNKRKHDTKERRIWINMWTDATVYQKRECFQWLASLNLCTQSMFAVAMFMNARNLYFPLNTFLLSLFTHFSQNVIKCHLSPFFVNNLRYLLKYFDNLKLM